MQRTVAIVTDSNYAVHGAVSLYSLAVNNPEEHITAFVVFSEDISARARRCMEALRRVSNLHVRFIEGFRIDQSKYHFRLCAHYTIAAYYRLFFQQILPKDVRNVLYLDCDVIVNRNVSELFDTELGGSFFAAVEDFCVIPTHYESDLLMPRGEPYCNTGIMLINLDKWRSEDALGMFLETNERLASKHVWVDQDLINATLFGRWLPLGPTYNFQTNGFASYRRAYSRQYREVYPSGCRTFAARDVDEASRCPHIIHYTIQRPWQPANRHPLRRTYWSYRNRIPIRKSAAEIPIIYYAKRLLRWPVRAIQRCVLGAVRPILRTVTGRVKKG